MLTCVNLLNRVIIIIIHTGGNYLKKIIGIFIMMLLIGTAISSIGMIIMLMIIGIMSLYQVSLSLNSKNHQNHV